MNENQKLTQAQQEIKIKAYEEYLHELNAEALDQEFCEVIGNECGELDDMRAHKGREDIIDRLVDTYSFAIYEENY